MTPSCSNCHGTNNPLPKICAPKPFGDPVPDRMNHCACTAEPFWVDWLKQFKPQILEHPWWQRSNFEITRRKKNLAEGKREVPFRLNIARGDLKLSILSPKAKDKAGATVPINSHLKIRCNQIPLQLQSLLEFNGLYLDFKIIKFHGLNRLSVGDFGGLHLIDNSAPSILLGGLFGKKGIPPPGYDKPPPNHSRPGPGQCLSPEEVAKRIDQCAPPEESYQKLCVPKPIPTSSLKKQKITDTLIPKDSLIGGLIPPQLFQPDGVLPLFYEVEDLINRILKFLQEKEGKSKTKKSGGKFDLTKVLGLVEPGTSVVLDLDPIQDFFLPGWIDLGESTLKLELSVGKDKTILGQLSPLNLQFDPIDYPLAKSSERPPIQLNGAYLRAGPTQISATGELLEPGLRLRYDTQKEELTFTTNLEFFVDIKLPGLGPVTLQGAILFQTKLKGGPEGLGPVPGKTLFHLSKVNLLSQKTELPIASDVELLITDDPLYIDPLSHDPHNDELHSTFFLQGSGKLSGGKTFEISSEIKFPLDWKGDFIPPKIIEGLQNPITFKIDDPKGPNLEASVSLETFPLEHPIKTPELKTGYQINFDLRQLGPLGTTSGPRVEAGHLRLQPTLSRSGEVSLAVETEAKVLKFGNLQLNELKGSLEINPVDPQPGKTILSLSNIKISANPEGSSDGMIRGPLQFEQKPYQDFKITWNGSTGKLELKLQGHHLHLNTTGSKLPLIGPLDLRGDLSFEAQFQKTEDGFRFLPGRSQLNLFGVDLILGKGRSPFITDLKLDITDNPRLSDPDFDLFYPDADTYPEHSIISVEGIGKLKNEEEIKISSSFKFPLNAEGAFYPKKFIENLSIPLLISFNQEERGTVRSFFHLSTYRVEHGATSPFLGKGYQLEAQIDRVTPDSTIPKPILEGAVLRLEQSKTEDNDYFLVDLDATKLVLPKLYLKDISAMIKIHRFHVSEDLSEITIPHFHISANPNGSPRGILRGPISIEQKDDRDLEIIWSRKKRQLKMEGLRLAIDVKGLHILPKKILRTLDRSVHSIGLDGRLQGHIKMNFPKNPRRWNGRGRITLRGDQQGDIYFLDKSGRPTGPPLFRDTRWSFNRISWINWRRSYALGLFNLDTVINPCAFTDFSLWKKGIIQGGPRSYGAKGRPLRPCENNWIMDYDNQPWSLKGFKNRIVDYINTLCQQDPVCSQKELRKKK